MDLTQIWGTKDDIGLLEIAARAAVMFVIMIIMIRLSGMRTFGKGDVFDSILTILFGAVLARGVVGATPFLSAVMGGVTLVVIHSVLSKLTFYSSLLGRTVKGKCKVLYNNGEFNEANMQEASISRNDIEEELRLKMNTDSFDEIEEIFFERNGKISFVKKKS